MNPNDHIPQSHTEPAARTLSTGGIGSPGRTRGTIMFVRNKETGLIEQAVVKLAQATVSHEQAEEIRARVAGISAGGYRRHGVECGGRVMSDIRERLMAGEVVNGYYVAPFPYGPGGIPADWWMACWAPGPDIAKWVDFCPTFEAAVASIEEHAGRLAR